MVIFLFFGYRVSVERVLERFRMGTPHFLGGGRQH